MMSITMAFRNLFRHKLKSILTILAITISVSLYIFMDAWILGMNLESRRNIVNFEMGAAKLQSKAYFEDKDDLPMYEKFNEWESYARALDEAGFESAPRFVFPGAIFSKNMSTGMQFIGCDPARDTALLRYADYIEMGRFISDNNFEIVMGANTAEKLQTGIPQRPKPADLDELITSLALENEAAFIKSFYESAGAEQLKLKPNIARADYDRYWNILSEAGRMDLMISTVIDTKNESDERDRDGKIKINHSYQVINVTLVGIVNSPDPMNNTGVAWMPLSVLQDEAGMMLEGAITELLIRKKNAALGALPGKDESPERIASCLNLPETLSVYRWEDYSEDFLSVSRGDSMSSTIMIAMLFLLSFLGIANTMLMAILERTKEFGMMRSLGMTDSQLVFITMAEAACIGIIGSLFGVIIGCAINVYMVEYGIDYSAMMDNFEADYGYRIIAVFKSAWNPAVIIAAPIVATVLSALMAFFPSKRAVKMEITACLRCD